MTVKDEVSIRTAKDKRLGRLMRDLEGHLKIVTAIVEVIREVVTGEEAQYEK